MEGRDIENIYSKEDFVQNCVVWPIPSKKHENFRINVAGVVIYVPDLARFTI